MDRSRPSAWWIVATRPAVLRAIVAIVGSAPAMMFVLNWTSKYLVDGWHMPQGTIGNYLVVAPLLFDVGAIGFGAIASGRKDQRTHTDLFIVAMLLQASLALAPLAPSPSVGIAICALAATGGGGIYALVTNDMLSRVPLEQTSAAGGMTAAAQSIAYVVAGPVVGYAVDHAAQLHERADRPRRLCAAGDDRVPAVARASKSREKA